MSKQKGIGFLGLALAIVVACASGAEAATSIVLPRAGQVGVGIQGQFGSLFGGKDLADQFGSGPGLAVRIRYRMRFERAIGLSFEGQTFDARRFFSQAEGFPTQPDSLGFDRVTVTTAGFEFYQMFGTRTRTVKMVSAGAGLAQISGRLNGGETVFPLNNEGFFASLGVGVERFVYRSWALDFSTRYQAIFHEGAINHDVQASVGLIFYASY